MSVFPRTAMSKGPEMLKAWNDESLSVFSQEETSVFF